MTESNDQSDKTLRAGARKPLSLQRTVESGHVRQNFSHGRSKSVVVEKKKTRKLATPGGETALVDAPPPAVAEKPQVAAAPREPVAREAEPLAAGEARTGAAAQRTLSNEERERAKAALAAARARDASAPQTVSEPVVFQPVVRPPEPVAFKAEERAEAPAPAAAVEVPAPQAKSDTAPVEARPAAARETARLIAAPCQAV